MIKTTILTGTEQEVTFAGTHTIYWVQNLGSGDILVGLEPELADGKDDVLIVPSGGTGYVRRDAGTKTVYLSGTGKAQVYGTNNVFCPFKVGAEGGGNSSSITEGGTVTGTVDYPIIALNLYGKSVQDGTPTPDTPIDIVSIGDDGSVEVAACGKNLANARLSIYFNASSYELDANSLSVTSNTGYGCAGATLFTNLIVGKKYTLSLTVTGFEYDFADGYLVVFNKTLNTNTGANLDTMWENHYIIWTAPSGKQQITFTAKTNTVGITLLRSRGGSNTETVTISATDIQLEEGTATEFEQYKGNTATITSGLPLCSGIDVRDELIYNADGTGKVIKHTKEVVVDGVNVKGSLMSFNSDYNTTQWNFGKISDLYINPSSEFGTAICSHAVCEPIVDSSYTHVVPFNDNGIKYVRCWFVGIGATTTEELNVWLQSNPVTFVYQLATPQEIELSAAEMTELMQLQTFNGVTHIYNDEGAEMKVKFATNPMLSEYVKPVIDGITARYEARIAALEAAVTNT